MTVPFVVACLVLGLPMAFMGWVLYMDHSSRWRSGAAMTVAGLIGAAGLGVATGPLLGAPVALFAAVATGWFAGLLRGVPIHLTLYPLVGLLIGALYPDDGTLCLWECTSQGPSTAQGTAGVAFGIGTLLAPIVGGAAVIAWLRRVCKARRTNAALPEPAPR